MTIRSSAGQVVAHGESAPRLAPDPVNLPMIRHWMEAIGDTNPLYTSISVAPPAMVQVWTMFGLSGRRPDDDPLGAMVSILDDAGYTSVVATNCEQIYHRYLRVGERVAVTSRLGDVVGPKRTSLGEGWFVTTHSTWYVGDEPVAEMVFRVLKFRPGAAGAPLRPVVSLDTAFFWDGTAAGELRIQKCDACGSLRHPPGPACPSCGELDPGYVVASGQGEVYSYVVHHHPPVPGRTLPFVVALVTLEEGVRLLAELVDVPVGDVRIGLPVKVSFVRVDDGLTLPVWRPR
jgi:uncharacterized OB-fold protein